MSVVGDIAVPVLILMIVGGAGPYIWARFLPEGVRPLMLNAALSAAGCALASALLRLFWGALGLGDVVRWVALTAIIWAPVVVLAIAQQPKRWKEVEW